MEESTEVLPPATITIIAALGSNRALGKGNELLWHLNEDMQFFKEQTLRHYVIMGRKSFESIPKKYRPLPDRVNIILSRDPEFMYEECYTFGNLSEAIAMANEHGEERVFIIGGGEIYRQALESDIVDDMFLTHVKQAFSDADVFFPEFNEKLWNKTFVHAFRADSQNEFDFEIYHYQKIKPELAQ